MRCMTERQSRPVSADTSIIRLAMFLPIARPLLRGEGHAPRRWRAAKGSVTSAGPASRAVRQGSGEKARGKNGFVQACSDRKSREQPEPRPIEQLRRCPKRAARHTTHLTLWRARPRQALDAGGGRRSRARAKQGPAVGFQTHGQRLRPPGKGQRGQVLVVELWAGKKGTAESATQRSSEHHVCIQSVIAAKLIHVKPPKRA